MRKQLLATRIEFGMLQPCRSNRLQKRQIERDGDEIQIERMDGNLNLVLTRFFFPPFAIALSPMGSHFSLRLAFSLRPGNERFETLRRRRRGEIQRFDKSPFRFVFFFFLSNFRTDTFFRNNRDIFNSHQGFICIFEVARGVSYEEKDENKVIKKEISQLLL